MDRLIKAVALLLLLAAPAAAQTSCGTLSGCPYASLPLAGGELMYVLQNGISKKVTVSQAIGGASSILPLNNTFTGTNLFTNTTTFGFPAIFNGTLTANGVATFNSTFTVPHIDTANYGVVTWGSNPGLGGSVVWNSAPVRMGGTLSNASSSSGSPSSDEFLVTMQSTQTATPIYGVTTNGSTATSSNILHFASVPGPIAIGMGITDATTALALLGSQTVTAVTATTVTMSSNANATVNSGDVINFGFGNFKGPLFIDTISNDQSTVNFTRASNGLTIYSELANGTVNGYAEGQVTVAQQDGNATGLLIGGEFDITPLDSATVSHCDNTGTSGCHTNLWVGNFGTKAGSFMFDSAAGGPGWYGGISIRNITAGGIAMLIPNNIPIVSYNYGNSSFINLISADTLNNVTIGYNASSVTIPTHLASFGSAPSVSSCGSGTTVGGTDTRGKIFVGTGTVTACTLTFANTYTTAPICILQSGGAYNLVIASGQPVVSGIAFSSSASMASTQVSYICMQ